MRRFNILCAVILAWVPVPAIAADMPAKAPVRAPAVAINYSWTGFYVGGNIGAAWLDKSVTEIGPGSFITNPIGSTFTLHHASVTGGVQAGYNWHHNSLLFGVEADVNWARIRKTVPATVLGDTDDVLRAEMDWFATFRGRLGYASGNWLIYATGGGALAKLINEYGDTIAGGALGPTDSASSRTTRWGWTVGGGVEFGLAGNWSAKAEYLFIDFGRWTVVSANGPQGTARFSDELHVARVGLNYRFGGPVVARY